MLSGGLIEKLGTVEAGGRITGDLVIEGDLTVEGSSSYVYDQKVEGGFIVDATETEALLIRKASDGGDVFTIDSTNEIIQINSHNGSSKGLKLGTTLVTADGGEINILDGATLSTAELNYVDGVTSAIQTQIDAKAPIANPTFTGNITIGSAEISEAELEVLDGLTVSTAEVNILTGVTSTSAELNYLDITTLGTAQASKAVTADASGNIDFNNGNMTNVDIDSGAIDGTNITVGSGKTLDVSGGTFTLANNQISGDSIDGGTISAFTSTGIDDNASSNALTIDSSQNLALTSGTLTVYSEVNTGAGNRDIHLNPHGTGEVSVTATLDATAIKIASGTAMTAIKDEDNMASDSATSLATQQSIKAYVDAVTTSLNAQDLDFSADSGGALNIDLDTESLTLAGGTGVATVGSSNTVTFNSVDSEIVHDNLSGFVADEHIAHSGVEVTAGAGLTGGGTIAATRTLNVVGGTGITANANDVATNDSEIVHDNLSGFVANEHIDHSGVTLTAGNGLSGGGDLTSSRSFAVDLNELATETTIADADFIAMVDATDDGSGKITFENLEDAIFASVSGDITITEGGVAAIQANSVALATDTTGDYVQNITAGTGLTSSGATSGENIAHSLSVDANQTQIVQVGTLAVGAISSGFGAIDIGSSTANFGATTVDSLSASEGNITNVGDIALDSISADGTTINVAVTDNTSDTFTIKQGSDKYFAIDTTDTGEDIAIGTGISGTAITIGHTTSETTIQDNLTITGNLKVNGDQVYQNVTQMAVTDPIISLQTGTDGANLGADTNKDVGLAMFWHNGSAAKTAFLGFDDSAGKLTFIPDATISSEVASGTAGTIVANLEGTVTGATGSTIGNLTLANGSITDSSGAIDFGNENLSTSGTLSAGAITGTSFVIGSADIAEAELEMIDGITAGTAAASKAVVLDGSKNIATIGTIGSGAITATGSSSFATSIQTPLIEYTDGDDAITIADGGGITAANGITSTAASNSFGATAFSGAVTTNSTIDGIDIATRDAVLTSTTTTANAALPKAGGTMTGNIVMGDDTSIGIADDAERIEFDGAGDISVLGANFGIGTASPGAILDVDSGATGESDSEACGIRVTLQRNGSAQGLTLRHEDASGGSTDDSEGTSIQFQGYDGSNSYHNLAGIFGRADGESVSDSDSPGFLTFHTTANGSDSLSERMRIDSSGKVGIGTSSPTGALSIAGASGVASNVYLDNHAGDADSPNIIFRKSRNATVGSHTIISNNDDLGSILFQGSDGNSYETAASIVGEVDSTPGDGDMPGRLVFKTTADGASSATERMRIDSAGDVTLTEDINLAVGKLVNFGDTSGTTDRMLIRKNDDSSGEINVVSNHDLILRTNDTTRITIDSAGKVGIGTASPDYTLDVEKSVTGDWLARVLNTATASNPSGLLVRVDDADSTGILLGANASGTYRFVVKPDGKVGIGTASPLTALHVKGATGNPATSGTTPTAIARFDSTYNSVLDIGQGADPYAMWIQAHDRSNLAQYYNLSLQPDGGKVGIGNASPSVKLDVDSGSSSDIVKLHNDSSTSGLVIGYSTNLCSFDLAASQALRIRQSSGVPFLLNTNGVIDGDFNDTSDIALKKNIKDLSDTLQGVKGLKPSEFKWKDELRGDKIKIGFIAQDVEKQFPELVNGEDGTKSINTIGLVSVLTKTVQDLIKRIEALENA